MNSKTVILGGGCFWCTEAIFRDTKGVLAVESGFSGGFIKNPAYREVSTGRTGHAEVIRITYDADLISYEDLLIIHFLTHDPTTVNKQGADEGTQYRSVIFYDNEEERIVAESVLKDLKNSFHAPIVTEIQVFEVFYIAEDTHQNYYNENQDAFYCQLVIAPKLAKYRKLRSNFSS